MNYEIFNCNTVSAVICRNSNVIRNWTCQKHSYFQELIFNSHVFQGHVTGISHTPLVLFVLQIYPLFTHLLSHRWHVLWNKIQSILLKIQLS